MMLSFVLVVSNVLVIVIGEDFCAHEYFSPECPNDGTIVMEEAYFGRMASGKCIETEINSVAKNDPKYFGCKADVLDILDEKCSGLQKCRVQVIDPQFLGRSRCYKELMQYLSVSYTCLPVFRSEKSCIVSLAESSAYISFDTTVMDGMHPNKCGSPNRPLVLETSVGQNIDLSVITFRKRNETTKQQDQYFPGCHKNNSIFVGKVKESNDQIYDVCLSGKRQAHLLVSKTNRIEIEISGKQSLKFLVKAGATGCYDLKPPQDAWMKREGNEVTVGCYMNRHTWKLFCNGRNWVGVIGNCTQQIQNFEKDYLLETDSVPKSLKSSPNHVFLIVVLISALFVFVILFICVCLLCHQRATIGRKDQYGFNQSKVGHYNEDVLTNGKIQLPVNPRKLEDISKTDPCYHVLDGDNEGKSLTRE